MFPAGGRFVSINCDCQLSRLGARPDDDDDDDGGGGGGRGLGQCCGVRRHV